MGRSLFMMAALAVVFGLTACKVSSPGKMETSVVKGIKKTMTIGGKNDKNPIAYSADAAKEGQEHFGHHWQICHGMDGQSTGVPFATKMSPPVPELTDKDVQDYTDGQLKWIIQNGIAPSGMPAWNGILDDDEMWKIVHYIRHLPPKGSLGTPAVFQEEAEEHEHAEHEHAEHEHAEHEAGKAGAEHKHTHTHPPGTPAHKD